MSFKVGDKVRIKGTEPVGVVTGKGLQVEFPKDGGVNGYRIDYLLEAGFELELVEPPLPEEFPIGAVFSVPEGFIFQRDTETDYYRIGSDALWTWGSIVERFGSDFTVLEERNKTIREVIESLRNDGDWFAAKWLAGKLGVSLDD